MPAKNRIIIDTDPGVDDVLALLLALSASPEVLEVALISVTFGNVPRVSTAKNTLSMFHVLHRELKWREQTGRATGKTYGAFHAYKPLIALGAQHALEEKLHAKDGFHGEDGLHGVHNEYPDLSIKDTWDEAFRNASLGEKQSGPAEPYAEHFKTSAEPAHKEILRLLRESPADTITIVALGPLTTVAMAAAEDPETFLRVKELVIMGGTIDLPGNITPLGEFNIYADPVAAARVFALTSKEPNSTMPPKNKDLPLQPDYEDYPKLQIYPAKLSRQLKLTMFPLDITTPHELEKDYFNTKVSPLKAAGSHLARWTHWFLNGVYNKITEIEGVGEKPPALSLHDPMCIWYMLTRDDPAWKAVSELEDIRVETGGQWTRGMNIVDRRTLNKPAEVPEAPCVKAPSPGSPEAADITISEVADDQHDSWVNPRKGNRINRIIGSPGFRIFQEYLVSQLYY